MSYVKNRNLKFINPYTFVPVQKNEPVNRTELEEIQKEELHTGVLKCRLHVITPLGIPDAEKFRKENKHISYPFFSYEDAGKKVLAIPGSSLRGTIRSIFEAATDSCFSTLRENTVLSRRVNIDAREKSYQPGILRQDNGVWHLYKAKRYLMATRMPKGYEYLTREACIRIENREGLRIAKTAEGVELRFGDTVEFSLCKDKEGNILSNKNKSFVIWEGFARDIIKKDLNEKKTSGKEAGVVFIGEPFSRKRGESIFVCQNKEAGFSAEELEKAYIGLQKTLAEYQDKAINKKLEKDHWGYSAFKGAEKNKIIPIWYSPKDKKLSLAAIGRTVYNTSLNELVDTHKPCTSKKSLCEACALFGMAQKENLGSRIRVTDARVDKNYGTRMVTLKVLSQPRPSYLPFYVKNSEGEDKKDRGDRILGYDDGVEIAGRKFYWHNIKAAEDANIYETKEKKEMNSSLELVLPGAEFVFDIYYDGITQEQLEKLIWCIHFGENRLNSPLAHKIGRGKPLGLGSVKMIIENQLERTFDNGEYIWERKELGDSCLDWNFKNRDVILKVVNLHTLEKGHNKNVSVRYPYIEVMRGVVPKSENDTASHKWFSSYKKDREEKRRLPYVTEEDQTLPIYTYNRDIRNNQRKNRNYKDGNRR